jgi:predicted transcriptional regulator
VNQKARVIAELEQGPATSQDVAEATGMPRKHCAAYLLVLFQCGVVRRREMPVEGRGRRAFLYELEPGA